MSEFEVPVVRVAAIEPIEGADRIELAVVGEYRSIVAKGSFKPGDLAVYLPEQAILPDWLIERLNLVGKLSGGQKNRIKAVKMKGVLSQGILYQVVREQDDSCDRAFGDWFNHFIIGPNSETADGVPCQLYRNVSEGDDVQEFLGIKKYDPAEAMSHEQRKKFYGHCVNIFGKTVKYDLENWKKNPGIFAEGDEVVITEKLHGTMCCFAYYPGLNHPDLPDDVFVYSKGLGAGGNVFKWTNDDGTPADNVYLKAFHSITPANDDHVITRLACSIMVAQRAGKLAAGEHIGVPIYLFGEVYGIGVQDLGYGEAQPTFRAFDVWVGERNTGRFLDAAEKFALFAAADIPHVPVLYTGPFNREIMLSLTDGKTTLGGGHIREGVVITSAREETIRRFGRKILKNVSGDYLTRKGETTEFQ